MRYEAPESLNGAVALLAGATGEVRVLAGGTDLLVQMRADIVDPELIVDIKKIPETRAVTEEKGGWRIGAAGVEKAVLRSEIDEGGAGGGDLHEVEVAPLRMRCRDHAGLLQDSPRQRSTRLKQHLAQDQPRTEEGNERRLELQMSQST